MRKSAVLVLNPPLSLAIISYIFVQEGINATYRLSSFEVKKAQTCNNFCAVLLIDGGRESLGSLLGLGGPSVLLPPSPTAILTLIPGQGTPGTCQLWNRGDKLEIQSNLMFPSSTDQ